MECSICLEEANTKFKCGHIFHVSCIKKYSATSEKMNCPNCRQALIDVCVDCTTFESCILHNHKSCLTAWKKSIFFCKSDDFFEDILVWDADHALGLLETHNFPRIFRYGLNFNSVRCCRAICYKADDVLKLNYFHRAVTKDLYHISKVFLESIPSSKIGNVELEAVFKCESKEMFKLVDEMPHVKLGENIMAIIIIYQPVSIIKELLEKLSKRSDFQIYYSTFAECLETNKWELIPFLKTLGGDINSIDRSSYSYTVSSLLIYSFKTNLNFHAIKMLTSLGAYMGIRYVLTRACMLHMNKVVEWILNLDPHYMDRDTCEHSKIDTNCPFYACCQSGNISGAKLLISYNLKPLDVKKVLHASRKQKDLFELMTSSFGNDTSKFEENMFPLFEDEKETVTSDARNIERLIYYGYYTSAYNCLNENPNLLNYKLEHGRTFLYLAVRYGISYMCDKLLEAGCDINAIDDHGNTIWKERFPLIVFQVMINHIPLETILTKIPIDYFTDTMVHMIYNVATRCQMKIYFSKLTTSHMITMSCSSLRFILSIGFDLNIISRTELMSGLLFRKDFLKLRLLLEHGLLVYDFPMEILFGINKFDRSELINVVSLMKTYGATFQNFERLAEHMCPSFLRTHTFEKKELQKLYECAQQTSNVDLKLYVEKLLKSDTGSTTTS